MKNPDLDLHTLHLVRLVAKHRSFTAAAKEAYLSQSALTRQVKKAEDSLGFEIFLRTTRAVTITEPGAILLRETKIIPNILKNTIRRINEEYLNQEREIKIGISNEVSLSHIPGLFHQQVRNNKETKIIISRERESVLTEELQANQIDLAFLTHHSALDKNLTVLHTMKDEYVGICHADSEYHHFETWATSQQWLLPPEHTVSRALINAWADENALHLTSSMEIESYDLINQLVMLELGVAIVPKRSLSLNPRKHKIKKVPLPSPLMRNLVVVAHKQLKTPDYISQFISNILFS